MLVITHTHAEGTLIDGTSKGDGTAEALKANRWRWGRSIGSWFIPSSRDNRPDHYKIETTAKALREAGFEVDLDLDETVRSTAEVEADKLARQEARAEALAAKAERKAAEEDAAWAKSDRVRDSLPEGGEPIKIGHHSEGRHRRAINKAHNALGRAVEAGRVAEDAQRRAEVATKTNAARYSVVQVANRIDKVRAEIRGVERLLNGYTRGRGGPYEEQVPPVEDQARDYQLSRLEEWKDSEAYWQEIRDAQIAEGRATNYDKTTIVKDGAVKVRGIWMRVKRANPKTVTVGSGYGFDLKYTYPEIQDYKAPEA